MINSLIFIHFIVSLLLITVILLQKSGIDDLKGISGSANNMGVISGQMANSFLTKTTIILGAIFFINAIILANFSSKSQSIIINKIENNSKIIAPEKQNVPIAQ